MMEDTDCGNKCRVPDFAGSFSRTLSVGLYAGTFAENIYRNVFVQMIRTPSERTMVIRNELNNVCSCLDDAVFAVEEAAEVVGCVFDVHELSGTEDSVSGIDKLSGADSLVFGIGNVSEADEGVSGIDKPSGAGADSTYSSGLQECIRRCVLFLDGIKSLSASVSECRLDDSSTISSAHISGGCGTISMSGNAKAVVMETLKDGIKALESALASLNGITEECAD